MNFCSACGKKTYQEIRYGTDKALFYQFYGYRGKVICDRCARPMSGGADDSTKNTSDDIQEEETYINPS